MTTKLPQGVAVHIRKVKNSDLIIVCEAGQILEIKGQAFTFEQLAERDQAIARAAFIAARERQWQADDYLQSEQFLKLIKGE